MPSEEDVKGRMAGHPYYLGFVPAMGRLLNTHPRIGPALFQLYSEIMFSPDSALSRQEREMIAAAAATAQDCFY